jgi:hypothetical protein
VFLTVLQYINSFRSFYPSFIHRLDVSGKLQNFRRLGRVASRLRMKPNWWVEQDKQYTVNLNDIDSINDYLDNHCPQNLTQAVLEDPTWLSQVMFIENARSFRDAMINGTFEYDPKEYADDDGEYEGFSTKTKNLKQISRDFGLNLYYLGDFACLRGCTPPINVTRPIKELFSEQVLKELLEIIHSGDPGTMNVDYVNTVTLGEIADEYEIPMSKLRVLCKKERIPLPFGEDSLLNVHNYRLIIDFLDYQGVKKKNIMEMDGLQTPKKEYTGYDLDYDEQLPPEIQLTAEEKQAKEEAKKTRAFYEQMTEWQDPDQDSPLYKRRNAGGGRESPETFGKEYGLDDGDDELDAFNANEQNERDPEEVASQVAGGDFNMVDDDQM